MRINTNEIDVNEKKIDQVTTVGIDYDDIINNKVFPGIMGKKESERAEAEANPNNFVTTVEFPVASVDKTGKFIGETYQNEDGKDCEPHNNIRVGIKLNIATYTNFSADFEDVQKKAGAFGTPARVHVPEGSDKGRVVKGGKVQFDLDLASIAKESYNDRIAGLKAKGLDIPERLQKTAKNPNPDARIDITTKESVVAKDGIGAVSAETLKTAFTQVAATSYLIQNKKDTPEGQGAGEFTADSIKTAGDTVAKSYNKTMKEIVEAVNSGSDLKDLAAKDKSGKENGTIEKTGFKAPKNGFAFKFVEAKLDKDSTAYAIQITGSAADAKKQISDVLKASSNRDNKALTQAVNGAGLDKSSAAYQVASSAKFNLAPVNVKDNDGKATSLTVVSPRVSSQLSPFANKVTLLNKAITNPEVGAAKAILGTNIDTVEKMSQSVLAGPQRDKDGYAKDHAKAIDTVTKAIEKSNAAEVSGPSKA